MSLQLILGGSGSGKSHALYTEVIQKSMTSQDTEYLIIVPEQFTMQTQKDLVTLHPDHGIMNIDILSFLRLAYRVFEEVSLEPKAVLDDTGKNMILRKVVENKKNELSLFQNNVQKQGFVSELKSMLSELYQYSITPEQLRELVSKTKNRQMLSQKLQDMTIIYEGFQELLSEKYITAEEILDVLCSVIEKSSFIRNSVICLDGFTGFTPSQNKLLLVLLKICKKVIVTVTIDERESIETMDEEFKLFHLSKKTIKKLYDLAEEAQTEIESPVYVSKGQVLYRFRESESLASLEHNLFRYPYQTFKKEQDDIQIICAKDLNQEIDFTIRKIKELIEEEGYRYQDIAVVTGDLSSYGTKIQKEYDKADIPCFIDLKKPVTKNPFVELILSLLDVVSKDFSYETVFRYLRNGLMELKKEEIDLLENYVIAVGIRGYKRWSEPFTRIYRTKGELNLDRLNEIRVKVISSVETVRTALLEKEGTVITRTKALYDYCVANQIEQKLELKREEFERAKEPLLAKEYKQVYGIVMDLFDQLAELLGSEQIPVKEYTKLLESGFEEAKVGLIPPGIDQIVVGDIERTRLKDIKALFFLGVNDGIIPASGKNGGLISDMERELLSSFDVVMAPTKREAAYIEQFYLYLNLTKPTKHLYITYSKVGSNGKSLRASYLIGKLKQLYPTLSIMDLEKERNELEVKDIVGADQGLSYLMEGFREYQLSDMPDLWKELFCYYKSKEESLPYLNKMIEGACYYHQETGLSKAVANALYGNNLSNSVTRLEKYASCAYAHFLSYGLDLAKRQEYQISIPDLGNIFHTAMELFAKKLSVTSYSWSNVPEALRNEIITESVLEATENYNNTVFLSSKRNEYMVKRVERIAKRTVWALCEHVKRGEFYPSGFELQFSKLDHLNAVNIQLEDKEVMHLQGRIDRVDTHETDEEVYVRVIDYKSGNTAIDLNKMYYGLQLQLVVYLSAALELEGKKHPNKVVIPAGIFYYNMNDPIVSKEVAAGKMKHSKEWEAIIEESILDELSMNGLVNATDQVIGAMDLEMREEDGTLKGSTKSQIIPVKTNKDGSLAKGSSAVDSYHFQQLTNYVNGKIKEFGDCIVSGDTSLNPYELNDKAACEYCDYRGVCGFDQKLPGNTFRKLAKLSSDQIWDEMKETVKGEKEDE